MMHLEVENLAAPLGAAVRGLDSTSAFDDETCRVLRHAFDERGLLVFRDVDIEYPVQAVLSEMLIGVESAPGATGGADLPESSYISNKVAGAAAPYGRLQYHSDTMWADDPLQVLSLYAEHVEAPAVPTTYASATRAWETLPEDLRVRVAGLRAVHVAGQAKRYDDEDDDLLLSAPERPKSATKPIALRHPRTGRTILYVCQQMTRQVVGLPPEESDELLETLFAHLYDPANLFDHEWRNGDLVIWDNLAVQHGRRAVRTEGPARTLRKFVSPLQAIAEEERVFHYTPVP